jgi:hypothetical protein
MADAALNAQSSICAEAMKARDVEWAEQNTADKHSGFFASLRKACFTRMHTAELQELAKVPGRGANPLACSYGNPTA